MEDWRRFVFIAFTKIFVSLVLVVVAGRGVLIGNNNTYGNINPSRQVSGNMPINVSSSMQMQGNIPIQSYPNLVNVPSNGTANNIRFMYTAPMQGNMYTNNAQRSSGCGAHFTNPMWR